MCALLVFFDTSVDSAIDATHIFDGLDAFPTHVAHMRLGRFVTLPAPWETLQQTASGRTSRLYSIALQWLKEDREYRRELEKQGRKRRGAQSQGPEASYFGSIETVQSGSNDVVFTQVPSDSETFYSKWVERLNGRMNVADYYGRYDYSH